MADNFHVCVASEGKEHFAAAMKLLFSIYSKAIGYMVEDTKSGKRLVLVWSQTEGYVAFPFKMNAEGAAEFCWHWLSDAVYPERPDTDGSTGRGFRVHNSTGRWQAFVCVEPCWMIYSK